MWVILVVIATLGAGEMGYRGATGYQDPATHQQTPAAGVQASHAVVIELPRGG